MIGRQSSMFRRRLAILASFALSALAVALPSVGTGRRPRGHPAIGPGRQSRLVAARTLIAYVQWTEGTTSAVIRTDIYVMGVQGGRRRRLTLAAGEDADPAWSPDGKRLVFTRGTPENLGLDAEVWSMAANGAGPRKLIRGPFTEPSRPDWTPAGAG